MINLNNSNDRCDIVIEIQSFFYVLNYYYRYHITVRKIDEIGD